MTGPSTVDDRQEAPRLSVVIVNWNAGQALVACLDSLRRNPPSVPWEAIVVDNASSDDSVAAVRREAPWARIIENDRNRGLAPANNQGLAASTGNLILISNPDVIYQAGAVDALIAAMDRHDRAAFVVPRLLLADGSLQTAAGDLPTVGEALLGRQAQRRSEGARGFWWDGWAHDEERTIGHGAEASYLVRRTAVDDIGPQDEAFPLDWEGVDWSARAWDKAWEVWFCPEAAVVHECGVSIRQASRRWIVRSHQGMYRYFAKRRPPVLHPVLAAAVTARAVAKLALTGLGLARYERSHEWVRSPASPLR